MYANVCELIGSNMKRLREKAGLSQKQMAEYCKTYERKIRRVESSCNDWNMMDQYAKYCNATDPSDFFRT